MPRMTGGEAIAKTLVAYGVEGVFGMTVTTEVPLTMSLIGSGVKMMTVRGETAGSMMATAYSKISGKPGVCLVSGAGSAHAALGMYEANLSSNAIVVISSDAAPSGAWRPGGTYLDQTQLFQQVSKWTVKAEVLESLPEIISRALRVSTTGAPGPVAVIVPGNLFSEEGDFQIPTPSQPAMHPALRAAPGSEPIQAAAKVLLDASKPAIIAGGGVSLAGASDELLELAELMSMPVATTHIAHGTFPTDHPLCAHVVGSANAGNRGRIANKIIEDSDTVLLIGTRMDARTTNSWTLPTPGTKIVQIDADPEEIGSNFDVEVGVVGDAKLALQALLDALKGQIQQRQAAVESPRAREIASMTEEWRTEFAPQMESDATPIRTPRLFREIQKFIDKDTIVVLDAGSTSYWSPAYLDLKPENQALYPRGYAALGSAFPMALGAQMAAPNKKVISISGDGAYGYNIMELETAMRMGLPVVCIVINNHTLGMERRGYLAYAGEIPPSAVNFSPQDFSKIAQAYDCYGTVVEKPGDIGAAIAAAFASGKPAIIDVRTDPEDSDSNETRPWRSY